MRAAVYSIAKGALPSGIALIWGDQPVAPPARPFCRVQQMGIQASPLGYSEEETSPIRLVVGNVVDSTFYNTVINNFAVSALSTVGATKDSIAAGLLSSLESFQPDVGVIGTNQGGGVLHLFQDPPSNPNPVILLATQDLSVNTLSSSVVPAVLVFQIDAYSLMPDSNAASLAEATALCAKMRLVFEGPAAGETLDTTGLGFIECSGDRVLPREMGALRESHCSFDLHLSCLMRSAEVLDYIEQFPSTSLELDLTA